MLDSEEKKSDIEIRRVVDAALIFWLDIGLRKSYLCFNFRKKLNMV